MTTVFEDNGAAIPVTLLKAGPCTVTFVRPLVGRGTNVQLGYGEAREGRLAKPERGHLKDLPAHRTLREFRLPAGEEPPTRGDVLDVRVFRIGDVVRASGTSKGKGFQGVVRRHGFAGSPRTHGHKHDLRAPGSIGSAWPQRVLKGKKMAGRMGGERVTVDGMRVVDVVPEEHLLVVRGAVPGARGTLVEVRAVPAAAAASKETREAA